jgi:hypothetical protein
MALPIRLDDEFVLRLPQDPDELTLAELDELRQWLDDTLRADRRHYLVLGSCAQDSHETRSEALAHLTERLVALGVEPDTIRCTHDGLNLPRGVDADAAAAGGAPQGRGRCTDGTGFGAADQSAVPGGLSGRPPASGRRDSVFGGSQGHPLLAGLTGAPQRDGAASPGCSFSRAVSMSSSVATGSPLMAVMTSPCTTPPSPG